MTNFAAILTGWSVDLRGDPPGFRFRPFAHEPGEQTLMGRRSRPARRAAMAALRFLANHPATHRFLATKLVRHFVADDPPRRMRCGSRGRAARHAAAIWARRPRR